MVWGVVYCIHIHIHMGATYNYRYKTSSTQIQNHHVCCLIDWDPPMYYYYVTCVVRVMFSGMECS